MLFVTTTPDKLVKLTSWFVKLLTGVTGIHRMESIPTVDKLGDNNNAQKYYMHLSQKYGTICKNEFIHMRRNTNQYSANTSTITSYISYSRDCKPQSYETIGLQQVPG